MYYGWGRYVPVAERRAKAMKKLKALAKKGFKAEPVELEGRTIAKTFWGKAWCKHIESFSDFENRLPRGTRYVRNGSVCHLAISEGKIEAKVIGSELYDVNIKVKTISEKKWNAIKDICTGQIASIVELLQGNISANIMANVTDPVKGLFPLSEEIKSITCSCLDWATVCKHVAAVLYGVGARLDNQPELLFKLRGVDYTELITADVNISTASNGKRKRRRQIADSSLSELFGIEIDKGNEEKTKRRTNRKPNAKKSNKSKSGISKIVGKPSNSLSKVVQKKGNKENRASKNQISSNDIKTLRSELELTPRQFAIVMNVSIASVKRWEKLDGLLNLKQKTLLALNKVKKMTPSQAMKKYFKILKH